jgi:quercetin dioxygenase-like cupin family protein
MSSQVLVPGGGRRPAPTIAMKVEPDAAAFAVFESELAPGAPGPAPHRHLADDEAFYVLAGSVAFLLDGEVTTCGPGSCVVVPRGVAHGFGNPSAEPARVLVVTTPGATRLVEGLHALRRRGAGPEEIADLYRRHDTELVATPSGSPR